jgi:hypothetical protein
LTSSVFLQGLFDRAEAVTASFRLWEFCRISTSLFQAVGVLASTRSAPFVTPRAETGQYSNSETLASIGESAIIIKERVFEKPQRTGDVPMCATLPVIKATIESTRKEHSTCIVDGKNLERRK